MSCLINFRMFTDQLQRTLKARSEEISVISWIVFFSKLIVQKMSALEKWLLVLKIYTAGPECSGWINLGENCLCWTYPKVHYHGFGQYLPSKKEGGCEPSKWRQIETGLIGKLPLLNNWTKQAIMIVNCALHRWTIVSWDRLWSVDF